MVGILTIPHLMRAGRLPAETPNRASWEAVTRLACPFYGSGYPVKSRCKRYDHPEIACRHLTVPRSKMKERENMYPHHNRIKQCIKSGELIDHYFTENYPRIGEALVLVFGTEPNLRPVRPHKWSEYVDILADFRKGVTA